MSVVPDSIDPVQGWKAFQLEGGFLSSPSYPLVWPVGEPAQAECLIDRWDYVWEVVPGQELETAEITDEELFPTTSASPMLPMKPRTILPKGLKWELCVRKWECDAPGEDGCNCGIHLAKDPADALGYGSILVKMNGWGKVVEHVSGYRVQYAYPSEIYVERKLVSSMHDYGVPLILAEDSPEISGTMDWTGEKMFLTITAAAVTVLALVQAIIFTFTEFSYAGFIATCLLCATAGFSIAARITKYL